MSMNNVRGDFIKQQKTLTKKVIFYNIHLEFKNGMDKMRIFMKKFLEVMRITRKNLSIYLSIYRIDDLNNN